MLNIEEIKIKFKFTDGAGETIAIVTIEDIAISLRGFRLMKSKYQNRRGDYLRVVPPTYGVKHHYVVYFQDKGLWYQLEDKVLETYEKEKSPPDTSFGKEDEKLADGLLKEG